jgi:hypothetical protein
MPYTFPAATTPAQKARAINAYCTKFGYSGDGSNASKFAFFQLCVRNEIVATAQEIEAIPVSSTAVANNNAAVATDLASLD